MTTHFPSLELMTIYEAAVRYESEHVPLIILAGKRYGAGSSRDWAAKAVKLLGVRAVIAESFKEFIEATSSPWAFSPWNSFQEKAGNP